MSYYCISNHDIMICVRDALLFIILCVIVVHNSYSLLINPINDILSKRLTHAAWLRPFAKLPPTKCSRQGPWSHGLGPRTSMFHCLTVATKASSVIRSLKLRHVDHRLVASWSQIEVYTYEPTQVHSAQFSLVVTHPSTNQDRRNLTSVNMGRTFIGTWFSIC